MQVFLVRHGWADELGEHLIEGGTSQAKAVAAALARKRVDEVFCSDLTRAKETAEPFVKASEAPVIYTPELREIAKGGSHIDVERFWWFLVERSLQVEPFANIAVFCHGNVIRYFLAQALKISPDSLWENMEISCGSISTLEFIEGRPVVRLVNSECHLSF